MADASEHTLRLTQPTIAFQSEATVAIGPTDLARELFKQCPTLTTAPLRPVARSGSWGLPSAPRPNRLRAALVCVVCLFVGVGVGHAVREGSAYASVITASRGAAMAREAHASTTLAASGERLARAKELAPAAAPRLVAKPARRASRTVTRPPPAAPAAAPSALDSLFVDFEPTFRPAS